MTFPVREQKYSREPEFSPVRGWAGVKLRGLVVTGDGRGREIGFPTANVAPVNDEEVPPDGVYACWVRIEPESEFHGATMSVGNNPTFDDVLERRVEAFVHDFSQDLYGRTLEVWVMHRLREMARFESVEELIARTENDVENSRILLGWNPADSLPMTANNEEGTA